VANGLNTFPMLLVKWFGEIGVETQFLSASYKSYRHIIAVNA